MKFRTRYLAIGLVTLLLGLVIFFPARVAYRWFVPDTISFAGISGSVWNGGAREAYAQRVVQAISAINLLQQSYNAAWFSQLSAGKVANLLGP